VSSPSDHFGGIAPFKVHVNFDILIVEGQIDADGLGKWLNMLQGYFYVHIFFDRENITFSLLKVVPHVKNWGETFLGQTHVGLFLWMILRNNITLFKTMTTNT
jgi:hypothetical protein